MSGESILIANRGEVALRVARAAADLGLRTVAVYAGDDSRGLHLRVADQARRLEGNGVGAYLDGEQQLAIAVDEGCTLLHPGYGFLAENAGFASLAAERGVVFVGPAPATLELLGDKPRARALARRLGVPVLAGSEGDLDLAGALAFLESLGKSAAMMVKAVAGGGGRGMREVYSADEVEQALERCRSEAESAFGQGGLYAEQLVRRARHFEVQVLGDQHGGLVVLGDRECSLQRCHQKLVELAPAVALSAGQRKQMSDAALLMARELNYTGLGTFEFLLDLDAGDTGELFFIEANPRLQVEHTVTEQVTGLDLVSLQLQVARGAKLSELGVDDVRQSGIALQVRINAERQQADGSVLPSGGTLAVFDPPAGPGLRVDTLGYTGYEVAGAYDSLLAKLVVTRSSGDLGELLARAYRALCEFRVEGVATNIGFLQNLLQHSEVEAGNWYTGLLGDHGSELSANGDGRHRRLFFEDDAVPALPADGGSVADAGERVLCSAMPGTVVSLAVEVGQVLAAGDELLVMESMKMEHVIAAPVAGELLVLDVAAGDTVSEGQRLLFIKETQGEVTEPVAEEAPDLERVRPDLAEVVDRHAFGLDENRPDVVARRRKTGQRTARENVDDLCDAGSFEEYGALVIAAQRGRREMADLIRKTPGDGMVCGLGRVNGDVFADDSSRCVVMSYDYSVLAGTQGMLNHRKKDRMFEIAREQRLPVVIFTEGGGGRPGDTDAPGVAGLDCLAFRYFGELSGLVPLVGVNSGYCFAGNAALLGCCDVIIATRNSSIGMGGPAMIEGGGLGVFHPTEVGPAAVQSANGVVDVLVDDEEQAVATAKRYLSYFQGPVDDWQAADQRLLREAIPENRLRVYDVRSVIETLADENSVLELRGGFGAGMVTALARIEGRPLGILANNPGHLAGAIDPDGADKAARFMQLCDAFDLPVLSLCDTPGIMVGPEIEKLANVRHASRMFVVGASMTVPFMTIVLRKGYGLGAQAMAAGSFHAPLFTVSWPTGEFGGMGLEGAVKLGFRKELEAVDDPQERRELYEKMVARAYEVGKAVNMASHFEIDDVIDPADSRQRVVSALRSVPDPAPRTEKKRPCIDTW